jgi:hypothetical protein
MLKYHLDGQRPVRVVTISFMPWWDSGLLSEKGFAYIKLAQKGQY